ncbi:MAG: hypothetical protein H5T50_04940 [Nitrososphaeria archaeon]|nr:hypothetical protein [Nitrososphaeria archaeon]
MQKKFADVFNFKGPISSAIRLLPRRPLMPGSPVIRLALKAVDNDVLKNSLYYLNTISGTILLHLKNIINDKFINPNEVYTRKVLIASINKRFIGGKIFEALSEIYLNKVHGWPELLPAELTPWFMGISKEGKPDLISISLAPYVMYMAEISKSFKSLEEYENRAIFLVDAIKNKNIPIPSDIENIKGVHYAIIAYEKAESNKLEKIREAFNSKIPKNLISKNKLHTEILDLKEIEEELKKMEKKRETHMQVTYLPFLREIKLF